VYRSVFGERLTVIQRLGEAHVLGVPTGLLLSCICNTDCIEAFMKDHPHLTAAMVDLA